MPKEKRTMLLNRCYNPWLHCLPSVNNRQNRKVPLWLFPQQCNPGGGDLCRVSEDSYENPTQFIFIFFAGDEHQMDFTRI